MNGWRAVRNVTPVIAVLVLAAMMIPVGGRCIDGANVGYCETIMLVPAGLGLWVIGLAVVLFVVALVLLALDRRDQRRDAP